jgi:hypothetical protein
MRIAQVQVAVIFGLDNEIVLTVGNSLKKIQEQYRGNIQILNNIPQYTPPNAPRVIFNSSTFVLNVALMRFDIMITPPQHISSDAGKVFDYIKPLIFNINNLLIEKNVKYEWTGFVFTTEFPKSSQAPKDSLEYFGPIFDKLVNINRQSKKMASFTLQYGFSEDMFFVNYGINGYEKLNVDFSKIIQEPSGFSSAIIPEIMESGISVTLDINNQPLKSKASFKDDFQSVLSRMTSLYETILEDTGLKEFV